MDPLKFILTASFGSLIQEIIHLYDIRSTLHLPNVLAILKSWRYWLITLIMIVCSGIGTYLLYGNSLNINSVILILGAAFPLLFKKLVASTSNANPGTKLGGFEFRDYFN